MSSLKYESLTSIQPAIHPRSRMAFLIDFLITLKCNYDCSYCAVGPIGHDNSTKHPEYEQCIKMLKQLYEYVDVMMMAKKEHSRDAVMNMYGGEAVFHPRFVDIAEATSREFEKYRSRWRLRRRLTTNGTATHEAWKKIMDHLEGVTMSYHTYGPPKLKKLFHKNLEHVVDIKKEYDIVVLMYPHEDHWDECRQFMRYCKTNKLNARPRLLDGGKGKYSEKHIDELGEFFNEDDLSHIKPDANVSLAGRACCGGRPLCTNGNLRTSQILVPRGTEGYKGWTCSANQFFICGHNVSGEYFTNKDCHVRLDQTRGPIATIDSMPAYTDKIRQQIIKEGAPPVLTCVQDNCLCGTCAPKARSPEELQQIMKIYNTTN
jgi:MoaA/NifB/PqqE/SkfB family radical SAM enzyme